MQTKFNVSNIWQVKPEFIFNTEINNNNQGWDRIDADRIIRLPDIRLILYTEPEEMLQNSCMAHHKNHLDFAGLINHIDFVRQFFL